MTTITSSSTYNGSVRISLSMVFLIISMMTLSIFTAGVLLLITWRVYF